MVEAVKKTLNAGEVCDWVRVNVKRTAAEQKAHAAGMIDYPKAEDDAMQARLKMRKEQAGLGTRHEHQTFVDFHAADEKRA